MKKTLLISLGAITAVAAPVAATVSCGLGSVFKSKINSQGEALRDLEIVFKELSEDEKLDNDVLTYTDYFSLDDLNHHVIAADGMKKEQYKGMTVTHDQIHRTDFWDGRKVWGFQDWTGTHGYMFSKTQVTLSDNTNASILVVYKYDKTNGGYTGHTKSTLIWNAAAALSNAMYEWKHVIKGICLVPENITDTQISDIYGYES